VQQIRALVIASLLAAAAPSALAQSAATVPSSSALYDRIEAVSAFFPARGVFLGERALSRREVRRVVTLLMRTVDSARGVSDERRAWAKQELTALAEALRDTQRVDTGRPLRTTAAWRADVMSTNAQAERIEPNGLGSIDAVWHPFAPGRHGWPLVQGTVATLAPTGLAWRGDRFAFLIQPNASLSSVREEGWTSERFLHRVYARAALFNIGLQLGAEEHRWGQSPKGSLFISGNALPLPGVAIGLDTAIVLPWLFRLAGPFRFSTLISDLGEAQQPPRARFVGWQSSIQPWSRFELGVAVTLQTGGRGGPKATFFERVVDAFPVIDALAPQHADLQFSNKFAGGNLRLRFPELSGTDLYYELQIDDFDGRRLRSSMVDDAAHLLGLRVPLLVRGDLLAWRAEWHRTAIRLYEHAQFVSGYTHRDRIIGSTLGPHATAAYLITTWQPSVTNSFALDLAFERRDPNQYTVSSSDPRDRGFTFIRLTDDPNLERRRATFSYRRMLPGGELRLSVGQNRARGGPESRDEWMGLVSISSQRLTTF
jgi:hypothetical protein